ncbi:hypothetical protein SBA7_340027 [Candidatus Sulfotelmatobacter sp. SbA7]|nr:hypothetical protein SBA7_340027 [Candidatus Sulfotelmatobacter sp. SbA7]
MSEAETEYHKLKGLVEAVNRVIAGEDKHLHDAETALTGNANNPEALGNLRGNLFRVRARILSELKGIVGQFG